MYVLTEFFSRNTNMYEQFGKFNDRMRIKLKDIFEAIFKPSS